MKIYKYKIPDINTGELDLWFNMMSEERRNQVMRLVSKEKRYEKIASDRLCKIAVAEFCSKSTDEIIIKKNQYGKPYAENLPVHFSISHSGGLVICAVSEKEIGIDIEKIRPVSNNIAQKFASKKEIEYINTTENGIFEIWTLKEAYFKCIGTGLNSEIKNVTFEIINNKTYCSEVGFDFSFHNIENGFICSSCTKNLPV